MENAPISGLSNEAADQGTWIGFREGGEKSGAWSFYQDQALRKTAWYSENQKQGHAYRFAPDGNLLLALEFDHDRIHGKARFFASDGQLIAIYTYIYDKLAEVNLYVLHPESPPKEATYLPQF